ncbi:MAG: hypothetical protein HKP12_10375 [Gammaproteobacteria bacterium]|nr:hypothetical protein [Gammaproteobacteria bacterium]NNJ97554.1 hypothetical protein [Gammaproteobacteria bacterium]
MYKSFNFLAVKKSLIFFVVVLVSMAAVVVLSGIYKSNASSENTLMLRKMRGWSNKIDKANRNNRILVQHEDAFKKLVENAVIGDENRLSWVEVVQKFADTRKIPSVKYDIASQVMLDKKMLDKKFQNIDVYKSVMSLDMKILHEGDLFEMMGSLTSEAKGLVAIDKCDLELIDKDIAEGNILSDARHNLTAYCELSWYTLKRANGA